MCKKTPNDLGFCCLYETERIFILRLYLFPVVEIRGVEPLTFSMPLHVRGPNKQRVFLNPNYPQGALWVVLWVVSPLIYRSL